MKQQIFEKRYQTLWQNVERKLENSSKKLKQEEPDIFDDISEEKLDGDFPKQYRQVCHHYAVAKQRRYSPHLVNRLNHIVLLGHHKLYDNNILDQSISLSFLVSTFPQAIVKNLNFVIVAALLFVLPGLGALLACYFSSDFVYSLMSPDNVHMMESMYDPANGKLGRDRQSDTDIMMFGFYIKNNIGIAFQTFASGIVFCLGSVFYLVFNGLQIGGVMGHLTYLEYGSTFYPFVVGHGSFELTAIVFAGAAGLKIGFSLIAPGPFSRITALEKASKEAATIMIGTGLMLLIAAFIEAFWSSSSTLPNSVKFSVGGVLWVFVFAYFVLLGRARGSE